MSSFIRLVCIGFRFLRRRATLSTCTTWPATWPERRQFSRLRRVYCAVKQSWDETTSHASDAWRQHITMTQMNAGQLFHPPSAVASPDKMLSCPQNLNKTKTKLYIIGGRLKWSNFLFQFCYRRGRGRRRKYLERTVDNVYRGAELGGSYSLNLQSIATIGGLGSVVSQKRFEMSPVALRHLTVSIGLWTV